MNPSRRALAILLAITSACLAPTAAQETQDTESCDELRERVERLEQLVATEQAAPTPPPEPPTPPPVTLVSGAGGRNFLNISLDALVAVGASTEPDVESLQTGGHDPIQRGFTVQNVEAVLDGAVDPYFRAQANLIFQIDADGETIVELEEAFATTVSLPHGLQVKAGHFYTEFGRLNPQHPHLWDFVDQPLVNGRLLGPDGMRAPGARLAWLMPLPIYSELALAVQQSSGETMASFGGEAGGSVFGRPLGEIEVRSLGDLVVAPRWSVSFDPGPTETVLVGVSGAFGPNATGGVGSTDLLGADFYWKWKPATASRGFPFVKVQAEGMHRRYRAAATDALDEAVFEDWGAYAQVVWGFRQRWTAGARGEAVRGDEGSPIADETLAPRWRAAANVSWYPTEYSKLRLQCNHDRRQDLRSDDSIWLQLEFLLGAHAAHKF